ncbi:MAG: hypothetical protein EAZ55_11340 [Cytophagales bacterium]|nr:MAG: hypothetical protein EAZ55_11340 [Cytophagales bacterium]
MKKIILSLLFLFPSFVIKAQTTIQMQKEGGVYTVPCKINSLDLKFIFDTGASSVCISLTEANFMLKNGYLKESDIIDIENYKIANGALAQGWVIILREVEFAGIKLYNVRASIVDSQNAPLLLGQSVIERLGAVTFDTNKSTLTIASSGNNSYDYYADINSNSKYGIGKIVKVYSYSRIASGPYAAASEIARVADNRVELIEKVTYNYYKVKYGNVIGYMWEGWIAGQ